jgi:hypothetical protein
MVSGREQPKTLISSIAKAQYFSIFEQFFLFWVVYYHVEEIQGAKNGQN